jgi:hypothetical protein
VRWRVPRYTRVNARRFSAYAAVTTSTTAPGWLTRTPMHSRRCAHDAPARGVKAFYSNAIGRRSALQIDRRHVVF